MLTICRPLRSHVSVYLFRPRKWLEWSLHTNTSVVRVLTSHYPGSWPFLVPVGSFGVRLDIPGCQPKEVRRILLYQVPHLKVEDPIHFPRWGMRAVEGDFRCDT